VSARAAALRAIREGFAPVPIPARSKNPGFDGWQHTRLTAAEVPSRVADDGNLGIILGLAPRLVHDVDLDCPEALRLADEFLSATGREHGRPSAPRSHRWYDTDEPGAVVRFKDPDSTDTLVELRGAGGQTVIPPSVHPSGERLTWSKDGEPASVNLAELRVAVSRLAAACLIARRYPAKERHDFTNALFGFLLRRGMPAPDVEALILAVARSIPGAARPEDVAHIKRNVADTSKRLAAGKPATGGITLMTFLSDKALSKLTEWLGLSEAAFFDKVSVDDAHTEEFVVETTSEAKFPDALSPEALYGLAGEFVRLVSPHTEAEKPRFSRTSSSTSRTPWDAAHAFASAPRGTPPPRTSRSWA
jgi:Bifunctional DNA primase/polymerase, N-terminal